MKNRKNFFRRARKKEEELNEQLQNEGSISGKDFWAMTFSAFIVFIPVCVALLAALSFFMLWLFNAL